jgi:hypothetical protein
LEPFTLCFDDELFGLCEGKDVSHTMFVAKVVEKMAESKLNITLQAFEDGPDRGFRNVGQYKTDAGETPKS